jgi:hypothetical protein
MGKIRRFTDDEIGYVADSMDCRSVDVAEHLGTTRDVVNYLRRKVRAGWSRKVEPWTLEEDAVALRQDLTIKQMAELLPGKSETAVASRRHKLRANVGNKRGTDLNPFEIRSRPLIAKTCPNCGLLLPSGWFTFQERSERKVWRTNCRKCASAYTAENRRKRNQKESRAYEAKAQAITEPLAENRRSEYTEKDHEILSNPSLTHLAKALALKRTYKAVRSQCSINGYKSHVGLGDPARDQWLIDNPNAARIEEITASLTINNETTPAHPDFEWDD